MDPIERFKYDFKIKVLGLAGRSLTLLNEEFPEHDIIVEFGYYKESENWTSATTTLGSEPVYYGDGVKISVKKKTPDS